MLLQDAALFNKVAAEIHGSQCGTLRNGTAVPCVAHRHFTATHFPFQVRANMCTPHAVLDQTSQTCEDKPGLLLPRML
jgi:hypothetical protein